MQIEFVETDWESKVTLVSLTDKSNKLDIYIQYKNENAGCQMTFYVKTVFINMSGLENLEFFNFDQDKAILIPQMKEWGNMILSSDVQKVCIATDPKQRSEIINI